MATCRRSIRPPRPAEGHGLAPRVRASLAYLTLFGGLGGLLPFASLYYLARGLDYPQIGALLSLGALLGFVAGPAWGALSDRLGGSPAVLLATATIAVAGLGVLGLAADFGTILAANLLFGLGIAGIFPIVDARAIEAAGTERAGWGPLEAWGSVGWVASSLATGFAVQAWGLGSSSSSRRWAWRRRRSLPSGWRRERVPRRSVRCGLGCGSFGRERCWSSWSGCCSPPPRCQPPSTSSPRDSMSWAHRPA